MGFYVEKEWLLEYDIIKEFLIIENVGSAQCDIYIKARAARGGEYMEENMAVYETLRSTIVSCEDKIRNATINMYIVYFAILSFGFTYNWLFMVSFAVLIVFQAMINADHLAITRASTYIRVFFEEVRDDIHWESINIDSEHNSIYQSSSRDFGWYINKYGSSVLASISYVLLLSNIIKSHGYDFELSDLVNEHFWGIFLASVGWFLVIYINQKYFLSEKEVGEMEASVRKFYDRARKEKTEKEI